MDMKTCNECKQNKKISEFNKDKSRKDGCSYKCKQCLKKTHHDLYKNNKEKYLDKSKKYYENNKEEHILRNKNYVQCNKDKSIKYQQKYFKNNQTKIREYKKSYVNYKYHNDEQFKIKILLRSRFSAALKNQNILKINSVLILIGCTVQECKQYLESQFNPEMNWENHGIVWEIDHIKPCILFDLTDIEQQKLCFHYTNLQPLFKTENRQKYNKYE
jgi:hypothetical protein